MSEQEMFDMIVELKTTIKEQALEIKHLKRELAEMDEAYKEADERIKKLNALGYEIVNKSGALYSIELIRQDRAKTRREVGDE